jgi:glycosyltransferase involved in cell wall biosynthesis
MRILFVYDALYPDRTGGVEHRNRQLACHLSRRGHSVTLAGWASEMPEPPEGVELLELPYATDLYDTEGKRRPWAAVQFARAVCSLDPERWDVIETANIPYLHLLPLWLRTRTTSTDVVVTWHEFMADAWKAYVGGWKAPVCAAIERASVDFGDLNVAVSEFTRARMSAGSARSHEPVPIVPNGIPADRLAEIRTAHGTPPGCGPAFVFAGRLHADKRVHLVLESLADLNLDRPKPWFRVIGDGPALGALEGRARELGLGDAVEFTGKVDDIEDVWCSMAECDFAVQPSSREGFGMFPLEAMGLGLPVILWPAAHSAVEELVRPGREGIRLHNDRELAGAQRVPFDDPEEYEKLREGAIQRASAYRWDDKAAALEELLEDL